MYSCSKCSYASKYRANLERHTPKCKGEKRPSIYSCPVCSAYTTDKKANFERHQASDLCKTKAEDKARLERHRASNLCKAEENAQPNVTLEQRVLQLEQQLLESEQEKKQLRKDVNLLLKWFENRPKTQEELQQEDEKRKQSIKRDLIKAGIPFDPLETLAGLRHLRQTQIYDKLNQKL